jgi:hypothetical protein
MNAADPSRDDPSDAVCRPALPYSDAGVNP